MKTLGAEELRRWYVSCPRCGNADWIRWENIRWERGKPRTAKLACVACGALIEERFKPSMVAAGEWRPKGESARHMPMHTSLLYSRRWATIVKEFLLARGDLVSLKKFVEKSLGEVWQEQPDVNHELPRRVRKWFVCSPGRPMRIMSRPG